MKTNQYLIDFYNHYDEDSRLALKHGTVEFLTTMRYIEKYIKPSDRVLEIGAGTGRYSHALSRQGYAVDALTFAAKSEPKDLFELVRKESIDDLMSVFPVTRLHYVAADGCALFMREAVDAMDNDTFELYLKYHFATCEREDLAGITSHALDIFRK